MISSFQVQLSTSDLLWHRYWNKLVFLKDKNYLGLPSQKFSVLRHHRLDLGLKCVRLWYDKSLYWMLRAGGFPIRKAFWLGVQNPKCPFCDLIRGLLTRRQVGLEVTGSRPSLLSCVIGSNNPLCSGHLGSISLQFSWTRSHSIPVFSGLL